VNWALLVGSVPRKQGMERKDLLGINGKIFTGQGQAIQRNAATDVRTLVVGNPCNTNCLIAMNAAKDVPSDRWFAMTMLDQNRAKTQLAKKAGVRVDQVSNIAIWGNHSSTQYPDLSHTTVDGKAATSLVEHSWIEKDFIPVVQQRGAAIIKARGASSAASAAAAAIDHVHTWMTGTAEGDWVSMAVPSDGSYGIAPGVIYSYPVTTHNGEYSIVQGLAVDAFSRARIDASHAELLEERDGVKDLL
jgi:malate dehydrogenase